MNSLRDARHRWLRAAQPGCSGLATASIGLFYALKLSPLVPDVMLSVEVSLALS
ncbi:MAG: hypothetical protein SNJ85_04175 [Cyanobacteriota bacterium]